VTEEVTGQLSKDELRQLRRLKMVKEFLDELKRRGISADLPVCPVCKSPRIVDMTSFQDLGYIGSFQPAYYCLDCGWYGRTLAVMSNRPENDAVSEDLREAFPSLREETPEEEYPEDDEEPS